jgi:hypothetical protein
MENREEGNVEVRVFVRVTLAPLDAPHELLRAKAIPSTMRWLSALHHKAR